MPKVSVFCPVYNAGEYLVPAIESILAQTFRDFEFVLYNDGSTDDSLKTLYEYADKDNRIRVIDGKVNCGPLIAINRAVRAAQGEFVVSIDSDDYYAPNFLEDAVAAQQSGNYDMVFFGNVQFINKDGSISSVYPYVLDTFSYCGPDFLELFLPRLVSSRFALWSRIIRTECIQPGLFDSDFRYSTGDIFVAGPLFAETRRFLYLRNPQPYYYYRFFNGIWSANQNNDSPEYMDRTCRTFHDALLHWTSYIYRMGKLNQNTLEVCCKNCELAVTARRVRTSRPEFYEQNLEIFHRYFCKGDYVLADSQSIIYPDFVREHESIVHR